jgi:hypothetical protein
MRSLRDLIDCQEGSERFPVFQVGKETEMELVDSTNCQEGSGSISDCQVGRDENLRPSEGLIDLEASLIQQEVLMKMGSVDLIVCQGSSENIPYC